MQLTRKVRQSTIELGKKVGNNPNANANGNNIGLVKYIFVHQYDRILGGHKKNLFSSIFDDIGKT